MQSYVEKPHLPQGRVRKLILGEKYRKVLENALIFHNIEPICLKNNDSVDKRLAGHCDLMVVHLGKNRFAALESTNCQEINNCEIRRVSLPKSPEYPYDARLNFCIVGNKLIYNPKTADTLVAELNYIKIPCRQGYTKCTISVAAEDAIITADRKIAEHARENGIDTLLLYDDSFVRLDGFEHGFIGGASFKLSKSKLAFTGLIDNQYERRRIEEFLLRRGIEVVYLTDRPVFDIGSAIPLTEDI